MRRGRDRQAPYTVIADAAIPDRPDSARLDLRVALDTIAVEARVICSAAGGAGLRAASIIVMTLA